MIGRRKSERWKRGWRKIWKGKHHNEDWIMKTDRKWVIVRIDGKISAVSTDYRLLAELTARIVRETSDRKTGKYKAEWPYGEIRAEVVTFEDVWDLRNSIRWEDMILFGTDFQKKVWRKLWEMTHAETKEEHPHPRLICYSDFAELCQNRAGVRAVAHAISLNPISVIIPCHLVIPKESIDRIREIRRKAESTIFKGDDLCMESILSDPAIDFGNYALGRDLKRTLISRELFG